METVPPPVPPMPPIPPRPSDYNPVPFTSTLTFKIIFIVILCLLLLIPDAFLFALTDDREERQKDTVTEISESWSGPQTIIGPIVTIPYHNKGAVDSVGVVTLLPASLDAKAAIESRKLSRSIYETIVYNSDITLSGNFDMTYLEKTGIPLTALKLDNARVNVVIGELKGIETLSAFRIGNESCEMEGGSDYEPIEDYEVISTYSTKESDSRGWRNALSAPINLSQLADSTSVPYSLSITATGSKEIGFAPVGKASDITIEGTCKSPSFKGMILPSERTVDDGKFSANWKLNAINRNYPQAFTGSNTYNINESVVSVDMLVPVDRYQKTSRALKYATLVILLTFIAALFAETITKHPIYVFQYLLIGLALVLFYSLLLSLSEHIGFGLSYLVAAVMTIALVGLYIFGVLKSRKAALVISGLLSIIYIYIYVLLNLETYALLAGSVGLFIALAAIMYGSLKMKWK